MRCSHLVKESEKDTRMKLILLVFVMLAAGACAFKRPISSCVASARASRAMKMASVDVTNTDRVVAGLQTATVASAMVPFSASAGVDASPVLIPIGISLAVMVPFLYYQQALRTKKETVVINTKDQKKGRR